MSCCDRFWERSRFEWRIEEGGDPAALLCAYLQTEGLRVAELRRRSNGTGRGRNASTEPACSQIPHQVCGAAVFISAAAAARMAGWMASSGRAACTPAPAVPDLVAVVYAHDAARARWQPGTWSPAAWELGGWAASWTVAEHARAVEAVRSAIGRGDVYQVNLVGHASARYAGDPAAALRRAAGLPGARYGGVLRGAGWALACASPETLVEVAGDTVLTRPIKGTRPATADGRRELLASPKERAEHVMIVDLSRNDLARVASVGSVRVDELYGVRRWSNLWQAESTVSARLAGGVGLAELLRAVCPGGSVTGAPKLAALDVVAALEPVGRGPSMGACGWIGPDRIDLGLTIRTVAVDSERVHVWAGGGITWGSDPEAEVAEAAAKAGPLRAALAGS
jgi:para-aminobenzoate synthetase component 1